MGLVLFLSASSNGAPRDLPVGDISADARRQAIGAIADLIITIVILIAVNQSQFNEQWWV